MMPNDADSPSIYDLLNVAMNNRWISERTREGWCSVFQEVVDSHYHALSISFTNDTMVPALLEMQAFGYFVAAVDVVLSGQVPACFALLRMCIECAVYACTIASRPELNVIWALRDKTIDDKRRFDAAFKITDLINALPDTGPVPRDVIWKLYRISISHGGHPNPPAALSMVDIYGTEGRRSMDAPLFSDGMPLLHALKATADVGYAMACLNDLMVNDHFAPKNMPEHVHALAIAGLSELGSDDKHLADDED